MARVNERAKNFLSRRTDYEQKMLESYMKGERFSNSPLPDYGSIFSNKNNVFRDIPQMLQDPIIASVVAVVMETAFQPTEDDAIVRVSSPFKKIAEELEDFHREYEIDSAILTVGYNVLVYGNVPIKMEFDDKLQFTRYRFMPNFTDVVPIVVSNRVLGYMFNGEFYDPYEFVYAQHLYYKDLGGVGRRTSMDSRITGKKEEEIENEFVIAPSYLSAAVRPWRSIKIIEDSLLLQRMDVSNFMRIIGVHVGENVFSKNAVRLMNFYRQVFKKVRRVSYDGDGMSSSSYGNEFEVILPVTNNQNVDIKDIGGNSEVRAIRDLDIQYKKLFSSLRCQPSYIGFCLRGNTKISLLDGTEVAIRDMHKDPAKYVGKQVYTCAPDGTVGTTEIKQVVMSRPSASFVRVTLDSGESFDVTPDHPCQLRDGTYKAAAELSSGQSLMPLYREEYRGYERFKDNLTGKKHETHRFQGRKVPLFHELPEPQVHHKDKSAKKVGEVLLSQYNHKVVSVEFLGVIEDAYDIEVASSNHNFALSAGVFVHNSDDGNSMSGDSEGTTNRRDERFGRLVKALRLSVTKAIKQIDVLYLRSKGYDVSAEDFSFTYVAASTVEDEERRETMKKYFTSIAEMTGALEAAKVPFNSEYLVKEVFAQALASTSINVEKLFDAEGQTKVPEKVASSMLYADKDKSMKEFVRLGLLSETEVESSKRTRITSSDLPVIKEAILSYRKYIAIGDLLAQGRTVSLDDFAKKMTTSTGTYRVSLKDAVLPPNSTVFVDDFIHDATNLASGTVAPIGDLYLVDGGCYMKGQDLYNYLYMLDQGVKGIPVQRVWTPKEQT